jgi:chaperonin GroES
MADPGSEWQDGRSANDTSRATQVVNHSLSIWMNPSYIDHPAGQWQACARKWPARRPTTEGVSMAMKHASSAKIGPLVDRVVVRSLEEAEQTRGGLFIPESAKEKPQQGEIVAVGPGRFDEGKRVPMDVKVGDKVLYGKYSGTEVTIDGERLLILSESDVLAIIG